MCACARVHGANVVRANICGVIYFHDTPIPEWRTYAAVYPDADPKRFDLYPARAFKIALRFPLAPPITRSTVKSEGCAETGLIARTLPLHFAFA